MNDLFLLAAFIAVVLVFVGFNVVRDRAEREGEQEMRRRAIEAQTRADVIAMNEWYRSLRPATEEPDADAERKLTEAS